MKGLLIKDLAYVRLQAKAMAIIFFVALFMLLQGSSYSFVMAYVNILFVMFVVNSINYDYFENGCAFLMTLPISKKLYVREKYVLAFAAALASIVIDILFIIVTQVFSEGTVFLGENVAVAIGYSLGCLVFVSLILPVELKFGPEKARVAMIAVFAVVFAGVFMFSGIGPVDLSGLVNTLAAMNPTAVMGMLSGIIIIFFGLSYLIAVRIMERKEF